MQRFKTVCWCLSLLFASNMVFAQQLFYIDNEVAKSVSATAYDPTQKAVMFFASNSVFYYPLTSNKTVTPEWYTIDGMKKVDAALEWDEDNSLFFDGTSYRMFNHGSGKFASDYIQWPGLPASWNNKLDGAVKWDNDLIVFFYNEDYLIYSLASKTIVTQDKVSNWTGWPATWSDGIDDAFNPGDGFIYFVRAGEIMPYSTADKTFFLPKKIAALNDASNSSQPKTANVSTLPGMKTSVDAAIPQKNDDRISSNPTSPVKPAISGCVTGLPAGSGFREIQTPIEGEQRGAMSYDNLPKGYHISELKVFTSKIWGKTVISGIQSILVSPEGKRSEQTVLGKKTITENSFVLDNDECITGINGTRNGESGNYIYSLQIITSKRTSQLYGERATETGRQPFRFNMPADAVFNGFAGSFNTNMTGIGIKYYGNDEGSDISFATTVTNNSNNSVGNNFVTNPNKEISVEAKLSVNSENHDAGNSTTNKRPATNEYLDNFEDYTSHLNNDFEFSVKTMPGIEWLGAGFDILKYDPLNPNEAKNKKSFQAIILTNSGDRAGNKGQYIKPFGSRFNSISSGNTADSSSWVTSYRQFANSFSISVTGSVKIPELGGGSQSGSFSEMNNSSLGSESIYEFSKISRKIHDMELMATWSDANGQKYKQKLEGAFRADIASLPVIKNIPAIYIADMRKGQPLPANLEQIKYKYLDIISKYGTHYASRVAWGGQYVARVEVKRADYESSRMSKQAFLNSAEVTIKKVTAGRQVEWGSTEGNSSGTSKQVFRRQVYVQGGNGLTNQDEWEKKVEDAPSPVEMIFTPYADLLTKEMFPDDPDIEYKSRLLKMFTEKYLLDNMRLPIESKDDFFRALPDLPMPGNLSVTNNSWLVLKFTVKYELNGQWKEEASGSFSAGMSRNVQIPVDAKSISLKVEYFTGVLDNSNMVFEKTFTKPELKCYKVTGTLFSQAYNECEK